MRVRRCLARRHSGDSSWLLLTTGRTNLSEHSVCVRIPDEYVAVTVTEARAQLSYVTACEKNPPSFLV